MVDQRQDGGTAQLALEHCDMVARVLLAVLTVTPGERAERALFKLQHDPHAESKVPFDRILLVRVDLALDVISESKVSDWVLLVQSVSQLVEFLLELTHVVVVMITLIELV